MSIEAPVYIPQPELQQATQFSPEEIERSTHIKEQFPSGDSTGEDIEAFRLEKAHAIDDMTFWNHIVTYLHEYRLQFQESEITQQYYDGHIRDGNGVPMVEMGRRAIADKLARNKGVSKVSADLLCMEALDAHMQKAKDGDTLVYASPPDPQIGYTYGFLYVGEVSDNGKGNKQIALKSIRLDEAVLQDYNTILSSLTGKPIALDTPNQFITNPELVDHPIGREDLYKTLHEVCAVSEKVGEKEAYREIINTIRPRILQYIDFVKSGVSLEQRIKGFHALEALAVEAKGEYLMRQQRGVDIGWDREFEIAQAHYDRDNVDFGSFMNDYGNRELEKPIGTCDGEVGGRESANMYGTGSIFNFNNTTSEFSENYAFLDRWEGFPCPSCEFGWVTGDHCDSCSMTQKLWQKMTKIICGINKSDIDVTHEDTSVMTARNVTDTYKKASEGIIDHGVINKKSENKQEVPLKLFGAVVRDLKENQEVVLSRN